MNIKEVKQANKKSADELQQYLYFRRRGFITPAKKGKGAYRRTTKHKESFEF